MKIEAGVACVATLEAQGAFKSAAGYQLTSFRHCPATTNPVVVA